ncbi:hypothetical protein KBB96_01020 [Luteolibacter ambystomatis]|uniref:SLA1 homology domain-containing protein n=1 Tax=Luteolibacter ambystomatis TaxID=2824561 RepID=A0A975IZQ8_9BACT|nr:SHD1 domain-containing protein [Luteolibacter ambystomatis]QUE51494.1 hypothetical protein KBB96_01020 [Luteolibacter ambystomatis]
MRPPFLPLLLLAACCHAEESSRTWTDSGGRSFEGSYVSATTEKVIIRRATDGKVFEVERDKLSQGDLDYLAAITRRSVPPGGEWGDRPDGPPDFRLRGRVGTMLTGYEASQANFGAPWPKSAGIAKPPAVTVGEQNAAEHRFIYESPHFRIQSDVALLDDLPVKIASILEAGFQAHHDLPLNNRRTRSPGAPKLRVSLYRTIEDFRADGGLPGTVGSYLAREDRLLIPLEGLGVKKAGSGYEFDFSAGFHNVRHELCHLLWADIGNMAGIWMSEGFAEYMACAPYDNLRFNFVRLPDAALEFAIGGNKKLASRSLGKEIVMPRLREFMSQSQPEFYEDPNKNYGLGLLLVYYFLVLDGDGSGGRFKAAIKACQDEGREEALSALSGGRDYVQLEKDFVNALRNKGVTVTFQ